jgi:DNA-binding transcriptional ArsR family regulator
VARSASHSELPPAPASLEPHEHGPAKHEHGPQKHERGPQKHERGLEPHQQDPKNHEHGSEKNERISLPRPDYDAVDVLVVREPEQLRALGDDLRTRIVVLLRERAASTTELAEKLELPKGTVGHHVKVLEKAGLIRVVRTRKVRAVTEKYYGRTARLFLFKSSDDADGEGVRDVAAASLRTAAEEMLPSGDDDRTTFAVLRIRLTDKDAARFVRRLERLTREFRAAESPEGDPFGLVVSLYRRAPDA